jgi:hypothetical protein
VRRPYHAFVVVRLESIISDKWGLAVVFVGTSALCAAEVLLSTSTREGVIYWDWFVCLRLFHGYTVGIACAQERLTHAACISALYTVVNQR